MRNLLWAVITFCAFHTHYKRALTQLKNIKTRQIASIGILDYNYFIWHHFGVVAGRGGQVSTCKQFSLTQRLYLFYTPVLHCDYLHNALIKQHTEVHISG